MRLLLKVVVVLVLGKDSLGSVNQLESRDNVTLQDPIIAPVSQHWEGVDGSWSTFEIRVGTPEQVYRVLPATSWQETWVIYGAAAGVCNTALGVAANCQDARGGVFSNFTSTSREQEKQYALGVDTNLGESGEGQYGFDTVGLGYTNETGPTLTPQIVSAIVSDTFWFGMFELGIQPTNFSGYGNPQASFSNTLFTNGTISSMSWSYTAGAYYRLKSVFGSLIFGGYDASRFTPNDVVFTMTSDNLMDIVLTIRSITATTPSGNTSLMYEPEFAFIDSVVPELWLPVEVCKAIEKAFGISLGNTTGTYLVDSSTHLSLLAMNPNITFTLGNQKTGGPTVDIVLPYASFDLNVTAPLLPNSSSLHFPLMRAADESQYTLGRTFLQEAYVTADYNSRTFNVSRCKFADTVAAHIVAIPSSSPTSTPNPTASSTPSSHPSPKQKGLSGGVIAGIVTGTLVVLCLLFGILICCLRGLLCFERKHGPSTPVHEINPGRRVDKPTSSTQQASAYISEVSGQDAKVEIEGNPIMHPQELEADVPLAPRADESREGKSDGQAGLGGLSTIREGRIPSAEVEEKHRDLGQERREDIISPATDTDTMGSFATRMPVSGRASPYVSTPSERTWSPSTPVRRRGSKFEEHLEEI